MAYGASVTSLRVLDKLLRRSSQRFRQSIQATYHGKVVRLDDARRFVTINRDIELRNLEHAVPFKHAKDIVLKNPQNIAIYECACRAQKKDPCTPTDVCMVVGEPFADLIRICSPSVAGGSLQGRLRTSQRRSTNGVMCTRPGSNRPCSIDSTPSATAATAAAWA